jgi:anion-transporting  ArsA/GET3 family ATPase
MSLLDKRVLIVTGKGGTGKTSTAVALGLWAARSGKRTLIVECNGTQHIGPLFRRPGGTYQPAPLHPGLSTMTITSEEAIEDYVVQQIKIRALYNLVFRNRIMGPFMDAVPGLHDAVHLGKVFDLTILKDRDGNPVWDLIIVDAPATGHGLNLLAAPGSMMELTQRGPVFDGVKLVHDLISDHDQTGIILTCLPENLPVSETLDLFAALSFHQTQVVACVLNQVFDTQLPSAADWSLAHPLLSTAPDTSVQEASQWTQRWMERRDRQIQAHNELSSGLSVPILKLPMLLEHGLGSSELQMLSQALEQQGGPR